MNKKERLLEMIEGFINEIEDAIRMLEDLQGMFTLRKLEISRYQMAAEPIVPYGRLQESIHRVGNQFSYLKDQAQDLKNWVKEEMPEQAPADTQYPYGESLILLTTLNMAEEESVRYVRISMSQAKKTEESESESSRRGDSKKKSNIFKSSADWVKKNLLPVIKKLFSQLWQIIANMLTPKEWKIEGEVGASFLGLGKAKLEITFGK